MNRMAALLIVCTLLAPLAVSLAAEPAGRNTPDSPPASVPAAAARVRSFDDRHRNITFSGKGWTMFNPGAGWHSGTAKSSTAAGDFFEYASANCTRLKWFSTKSNSRGRAAVYVDGELKATVDTFNPTTQTTAAVFDSGELPLGRHALKVVGLRPKSLLPATTGWNVTRSK